jgi:hypothetical protein
MEVGMEKHPCNSLTTPLLSKQQDKSMAESFAPEE